MPLTLTPGRVAPVYPQDAEIYDVVAGTAISPGAALRLDTSGQAVLADATGTASSRFRGLALGSAGGGQGLSLLKRGHVYGYDLSALAYGAPVYLDNDAGALSSAAGSVSVVVGTVVSLPDHARTKVLYLDADWLS